MVNRYLDVYQRAMGETSGHPDEIGRAVSA
jgi:hypothetical protein